MGTQSRAIFDKKNIFALRLNPSKMVQDPGNKANKIKIHTNYVNYVSKKFSHPKKRSLGQNNSTVMHNLYFLSRLVEGLFVKKI